jgi:pimeloyl-ACP methyl ester carboxylesterase
MNGTSHTLDRDEVSLYYELHGPSEPGPAESLPLLLTHGFGANTEMWRPNLPALAAHRRVIIWDIRGHGRSRAPLSPEWYSQDQTVADMAALLDAVGVERAAIGGLSLGGYLSLAFHLSHPERTAALALFDTGPGYKNDQGREGWNRYAEGLAQRFDAQGLEALGTTAEQGVGEHDATGLALAARGILTQHDPSVINSLPGIRVPTLVLVGEEDRNFLTAAEYMSSRIPGARRVVVPGAGHAANIDQPELFDRAVEDFLAAVPE